MTEDVRPAATADADYALSTLRRVWPQLNWVRDLNGRHLVQINGFIPPEVDQEGSVRGGLDVLVHVYKVGDTPFNAWNGSANKWGASDAEHVRTQARRIVVERSALEVAVADYREASISATKRRLELYGSTLHTGGAHD